MRLVLVNNYKEADKRQEVLRNLTRCTGQKVDVVDYDLPDLAVRVLEMDPDLVFLSGSGYLLTRPGTRERFQPEMDMVRRASFPILGICYGHQLVGTAFGASMTDLGQMVRRFEDVKIIDHHPVFNGLPSRVQVAESHRQVLDQVPDGFVRLAESQTSHVEAMCHETRPIYGFQFHAERADDAHSHGRTILGNLLKLARN